MDNFPSEEIVLDYLQRLFPLNRGLAGPQNRKTLNILSEIVPIDKLEVPSGKSISGWTVPEEWILTSATITDSSGRIIVNAADNPLHVHSNSISVNTYMEFKQLLNHLAFDSQNPNAILYRTNYYHRIWGFSVSMAQLEKLKRTKGPLHVRIDASFIDGSMTIGEVYFPGKLETEILVSSYICHPFIMFVVIIDIPMKSFVIHE
jgi:aminopeptidase-like protein